MIMTAIVIQVQEENLIAIDLSNYQEVLVHFNNSSWYLVGDIIEIIFDEIMTLSIPPQINALSIQLITPPQSPPPILTEIEAIVVIKDRQFLEVRNLQYNIQLHVTYDYAYHFCVGQRVSIMYDTVILDNLTTINAIDITPIC